MGQEIRQGGHESGAGNEMNKINIKYFINSDIIHPKVPIVFMETNKKTRLVTARLRRNNMKFLYIVYVTCVIVHRLTWDGLASQ